MKQVSAHKALQIAEQERQSVQNRLRYLAAEQEKYEKQIMSAKNELAKRNQIKASKLEDLRLKIQMHRERESDMSRLNEHVRYERDKNQS